MPSTARIFNAATCRSIPTWGRGRAPPLCALPPDRQGEEVRRPENAEVLVRVIESEVDPFGGVHETATERQALQAFLVVERRRLIDRNVVRPLVGVAPPQRDAEVRSAQLVHGPLGAAGE